MSSTSAVHGGTGTTSTPANNIGGSDGSRRPSQGTLFSGLVNQKRNSTDAAAAARRASFAEQKPATGVIGSMWTKFTAGHDTK